MRPVTMQPQNAQLARTPEARGPVAKAFLSAIERFAMREKLSSGVFRLVDEFAGIDRLDRAELDETDDDDRPAR